MTDQEILAFIREQRKDSHLSIATIAELSGVARESVKAIMYGAKGLRVRTAARLLKAFGFKLKIVPIDGPRREVVISGKSLRPAVVNGKHVFVVRPENEAACLKCGRDAGVVTVSGHDQCAHCGHILADCCGD